MNLSLIEDDLDEVNVNLIYLSKIQEDLIYNVNLHRSGRVITVITEYQKSLNELELIKLKIIELKNSRIFLKTEMEKKLKSYDYYLDQYEKIYNELEEPVVLIFKRNKK